MPKNRVPRMVLEENFLGIEKSTRGRPKNSWITTIKRDIVGRGQPVTSLKHLEKLAADRTSWRKNMVFQGDIQVQRDQYQNGETVGNNSNARENVQDPQPHSQRGIPR